MNTMNIIIAVAISVLIFALLFAWNYLEERRKQRDWDRATEEARKRVFGRVVPEPECECEGGFECEDCPARGRE